LRNIKIKHARTGQIIFSGHFSSIRHAVEAAIRDKASLAFADLRHANLVNAQMDGAILDGAILEEANLMGANLSEASLRQTSLSNAQLYNAILCETVLDAANCRGSLFGATDISGAKIRHCVFDSLSALDLNFRDTDQMRMNSFEGEHEHLCAFSRPPLTLKGLALPITCFDHAIMVDRYVFTELTLAKSCEIPSRLRGFVAANSGLIQHVYQDHCHPHLQAA